MTENKVKLKAKGLYLSFGGVSALSGVDMELRERELLAIIGPNGAGKTSLLNCINGFYQPQKGDIFFEGRMITGLPPHRIAKLGIARVFQGIQLYSGLTVLDNLMAARHIHMTHGLWSEVLYFGKARNAEIQHRKKVEEIVDFLEMEPVRKKVVSTLSYGLRKRVDLGRALALEPKLLILDEPMGGMNLEEKEDISRFIMDIHELMKIPIIIVEHDMGVVMSIAERIMVLDFGELIAQGRPDEIKTDPKVITAYLGSE